MESRHDRYHHGDALTHLEGVGPKLGNKGSDRRMERTLVEVEEQTRRLLQLVCDLLTTNEELRFQLAQSDSEP